MQRLREAGISEEQLARVHAPIGLDIGARSPAEIALSIIAEIKAVLSGEAGGSLRYKEEVIHARSQTKIEAKKIS